MPAELSDLPETPTELEDFVAALFHASGHYVENNIHAEELELDLVATDYSQDPPIVILGEVKSGNWGYGELFKLVGWMRYLGIDEGALFCQGIPEDKDLASMEERFSPMGVTVADLGDCIDQDADGTVGTTISPSTIRRRRPWRIGRRSSMNPPL